MRWRGCSSLSMVDNSLFSVLLPTIVSKDSSLRPITEPALLMILSKSVGVTISDAALPTQSRKGNAAGNNRLVEDLQHFAAQVLRISISTGNRVCSPELVTLFSYLTFQSWVIMLSSLYKVVYQCPVLTLLSLPETHDKGWVVRKLLQVTWLRVAQTVGGV